MSSAENGNIREEKEHLNDIQETSSNSNEETKVCGVFFWLCPCATRPQFFVSTNILMSNRPCM